MMCALGFLKPCQRGDESDFDLVAEEKIERQRMTRNAQCLQASNVHWLEHALNFRVKGAVG